jgi:D-alanyl-D-alanine carboxypeptidase (penicillin-binding protein 5/6)
MKRLFLLLATLMSLAVHAAPATAPEPPGIAAKAYLLADHGSGQILAQQAAQEKIEPASLTKLMTAYVTFGAIKKGKLKLTQNANVSEKAWKAEGSRMFIEPNKPVTVDELLKGMIVQSGNDACIALAEAVAGTEEAFVELMNKEAQRLGLKNSHYMNATGLPHPQHYSTAHDLSLLTRALIRDFPEFYPLYAIKDYRYNNITQPNRNRLLWQDPYVDGVKTGHTEAAGYCLVSSAKRGDMRLISVVLNAASDAMRASESQKLLNFGFQNYESHRLYPKGQQVSELTVWKGNRNKLKAGAADDIVLVLPQGQYASLKASLVTRQPLLAPISPGQQVGSIRLTLGDKLVAEFPLSALEEVPVAGIFGRAWDTVKLWFN